MTDNARILIYDFEVSDLDADWGVTLCTGYKWLDDPQTHVLSQMDYKGWKKNFLDDSRLWRDFMDVFNQADLTIGYFNSGFDRPYMYAKLLRNNISIPANIPNIDLFFTAKSNMKIRRKSMDNVTRYLGLQDEDLHKTIVGGDMWQRARIGDEEGLRYVIEHCHSDLLLTERLYYKFRPLIRTHPRIAAYGTCNHCGGNRLQRRGYALTSTKGRRVRAQCQDCAAWHTFSETDILKSLVTLA